MFWSSDQSSSVLIQGQKISCFMADCISTEMQHFMILQEFHRQPGHNGQLNWIYSCSLGTQVIFFPSGMCPAFLHPLPSPPSPVAFLSCLHLLLFLWLACFGLRDVIVGKATGWKLWKLVRLKPCEGLNQEWRTRDLWAWKGRSDWFSLGAGENLNQYSRRIDRLEMTKRDGTETSYFHKKLLSFHKKQERTESLWKTPWDGQVREQKGDGLCLIFCIFFEDNDIFVRREKRLYWNGEENRKNISSKFNGIKKPRYWWVPQRRRT